MDRWEDNINQIFKKWEEGTDWIHLYQDSVKWWVVLHTIVNCMEFID